jgi:hypothetical protein
MVTPARFKNDCPTMSGTVCNSLATTYTVTSAITRSRVSLTWVTPFARVAPPAYPLICCKVGCISSCIHRPWLVEWWLYCSQYRCNPSTAFHLPNNQWSNTNGCQ